MSRVVYRFMEIAKFIDLIVHEDITLVSPRLWEDPYEMKFFEQYISQYNKTKKALINVEEYGYDLEAIMKIIISFNLFASCWTRIDESDAMWRIYSNNNQSVRIGVKEDKLKELKDCVLIDVKYRDYQSCESLINCDFYELFSTKRFAFEHEQEVRLISHLKFTGHVSEMQEYINAMILTIGKDIRLLPKDVKVEEISKIVDNALELTNLDDRRKIKKISIKPVNNFIDSVMLHPMASDWLDNTMITLCNKLDLNYLGKSKLYEPT